MRDSQQPELRLYFEPSASSRPYQLAVSARLRTPADLILFILRLATFRRKYSAL